MIYMLDTDICSYLLKRKPVDVIQNMTDKTKNNNILCVSVITYGELMFGAENSAKKIIYKKAIIEVMDRLNKIYSWGMEEAERFAELKKNLATKGHPIGVNDTMIAAHALSLEATLVTNNEKHFKKVPKLKIENWTK